MSELVSAYRHKCRSSFGGFQRGESYRFQNLKNHVIKLRNRGAMSFHEIKTEHFRVLCSVLFSREDKVKVSLKGGWKGMMFQSLSFSFLSRLL